MASFPFYIIMMFEFEVGIYTYGVTSLICIVKFLEFYANVPGKKLYSLFKKK